MGSYTTNYNLYKTNMLTDGNDLFDFKRDLDDNWDKLDTALASLSADKANKSLNNVNSTAYDLINQSKAFMTGSVSGNPIVYADIFSRLHTTFDSNKFILYGNPTITDDGIATTTQTQAIEANVSGINLTNVNDWVIYTPKFKITGNGVNFECFVLKNNGSGTALNRCLFNFKENNTVLWVLARDNYTDILRDNTLAWATNDKFQFKVIHTSSDNTYSVFYTKNGGAWTLLKSVVDSNAFSCGYGFTPVLNFNGEADLKQTTIIVDGVEVFSGNKTGSDSYSINGSTVTVPYTLTKGGAKIADVSGRTDVTSVYNAFGYAPYYTIDTENKDFTLPMGDLYGQALFRNHKEEINEYLTLDSANTVHINYNTEYTAPADGWAYYNTHLQVSANVNNGTSNIQVYGSIDNFVYYGHFLQITWDGSANTVSTDGMQSAAFFVKKGQKIKMFTDNSSGDFSIISYDCRFIPCIK